MSSAYKEVSPVAGVAIAVKVQHLGMEPSGFGLVILVLVDGQCLVIVIVVMVLGCMSSGHWLLWAGLWFGLAVPAVLVYLEKRVSASLFVLIRYLVY